MTRRLKPIDFKPIHCRRLHWIKALRKSPDYADAWFFKAQLHRDLERDDVVEVLKYALSLDGEKFPFGWVELAQIQWERGLYVEGLATLDILGDKALPLTSEMQEKRRVG